jgi:hypothetical protein
MLCNEVARFCFGEISMDWICISDRGNKKIVRNFVYNSLVNCKRGLYINIF